MTNEEIEQLWQDNIKVISKMDTAAGSLIKTVLLTAEKNGPAYVRLTTFMDKTVKFKMVEGDDHLIHRCSVALGATCQHNQLGSRS